MKSISLPFTDAVLLLTPPSALLFLGLIPLALVIWLYRYELRLIARAAALGLLGLRIFVLLFILALLGLQPSIARSTSEELRGRVLVAVDRSASMDIADPQRPPIDKLRLAPALKLGDDVCPDTQLTGWVKLYAETKTVEWLG